jgi:hypothetical protein
MKNLLFASLAMILSISFTIAQNTIQWQKSLGGSDIDRAEAIQQTNDGGYIVAGFSYSNDGDVSDKHGGYDCWVVKLTNLGSIEWQKSLGGTEDDGAFSIQQTNDGGYIFAGYSNSNDGDVSGNLGYYDYWVVKLSSIGTIEWQKSLGGSGYDFAMSIQQTNDGGYIVAGESYSDDGDVSGHNGSYDFWVVKLSVIGTIEWQKSLGGQGDDVAFSIQQTIDGGYIVAGYSYSNDGDVTGSYGLGDSWVVKLNNIGTIEWQKSLGGFGHDNAYSIQQTNDGGFIVAGYSDSNDGEVSDNHGYYDCLVMKLSSIGSIVWQKSLGGSNGEFAYSIQQTNDGGYIVAGYSDSNDGDVTGNQGGDDYWVVKLTSLGTIEWQKSLGGTGAERAKWIQQTYDGGYIVAGYSPSNDGDVSGNHGDTDYWVVKLNSCQLSVNTQPANQIVNINDTAQFVVSSTYSLSNFQWQTDIGIGFQDLNSVLQYTGTTNDTLTISNVTLANNNQTFRCIISSGSCLDTTEVVVLTVLNTTGINEASQVNLFSVYPNPAQHIINLNADSKLLASIYTIYDNTGKMVLSGEINSQEKIIEIGNLSSGIYLFRVGENQKQIFKVIKE